MSRAGAVSRVLGSPVEVLLSGPFRRQSCSFLQQRMGEHRHHASFSTLILEAGEKQAESKPTSLGLSMQATQAQAPEKHTGEGPHLTPVLENTRSHVRPLPRPLRPYSAASEGPAERN